MLYELTRSSIDPRALSLAFRGLFVGIIPLIMLVTGMTSDTINTLLDQAQEFIFLALSAYSVGAMFIGLLRKAYVGQWTAKE